jgi:hypothetical protein
MTVLYAFIKFMQLLPANLIFLFFFDERYIGVEVLTG